LKKICLDLKNKLNDYVVVLCANIGGKPSVAVGISETVVVARQLDAGAIIKQQVAPLIKGGGGGQKTLATAGGQDAGNLEQVIAAEPEFFNSFRCCETVGWARGNSLTMSPQIQESVFNKYSMIAIRAGCPIALAKMANSFCVVVKCSVFVIPISLYFYIAILR
jgi:hypothetical protein